MPNACPYHLEEYDEESLQSLRRAITRVLSAPPPRKDGEAEGDVQRGWREYEDARAEYSEWNIAVLAEIQKRYAMKEFTKLSTGEWETLKGPLAQGGTAE